MRIRKLIEFVESDLKLNYFMNSNLKAYLPTTLSKYCNTIY